MTVMNRYSGWLVALLVLGFFATSISQDDGEEPEGEEPEGEDEGEEADPIIVETPLGSIQGVEYDNVLNGTYFAFVGIPYALPPVGDRRFMPPQPVEPWEGILDASEDKSSCLQMDAMSQSVVGSEDCLHLGVFTPKHPNELNNNPLPIIVYIHGGAFHFGKVTGDTASADYLMTEDIILVIFHYRLNIYGFLSFQDLVLPGNAGLKDQLLVLRWVHDNIASFGGDPKRVTISGYSAGSSSVQYHMMSPLSRGLFHNAIMDAGTAIAPWAFCDNAKFTSDVMAEVFNCSTKGNVEVLKCLQEVDATLLTKAQYNAIPIDNLDYGTNVIFVPTKEPEHKDAFITDYPINILLNGDYADVPLLTGVCELESGLIEAVLSLSMVPLKFRLKVLGFFSHLDLLLPRKKPYVGSKRMADSAMNFYFKGKQPTVRDGRRISELFSDLSFNIPMFDTMKLHKIHKKSSVYQYFFTHDTNYSIIRHTMFFLTTETVTHGDYMSYIFYLPQNEVDLDHPAITTVKRAVKFWANFATTGNPTPDNSIGIHWPEFSLENREYLDFNETLSIKKSLFEKRVEFWRQEREKENFVI